MTDVFQFQFLMFLGLNWFVCFTERKIYLIQLSDSCYLVQHGPKHCNGFSLGFFSLFRMYVNKNCLRNRLIFLAFIDLTKHRVTWILVKPKALHVNLAWQLSYSYFDDCQKEKMDLIAYIRCRKYFSSFSLRNIICTCRSFCNYK